MEIGDKLIDEIHFINEYDHVVDQVVEYDWMPIKCANCQCMGHSVDLCRKTETMVWRKKEVAIQQEPKKQESKIVAEPVPDVVTSLVVIVKDSEAWITPRKNKKTNVTGSALGASISTVVVSHSDGTMSSSKPNGLPTSVERSRPK